jgi:hypothetical protein
MKLDLTSLPYQQTQSIKSSWLSGHAFQESDIWCTFVEPLAFPSASTEPDMSSFGGPPSLSTTSQFANPLIAANSSQGQGQTVKKGGVFSSLDFLPSRGCVEMLLLWQLMMARSWNGFVNRRRYTLPSVWQGVAHAAAGLDRQECSVDSTAKVSPLESY